MADDRRSTRRSVCQVKRLSPNACVSWCRLEKAAAEAREETRQEMKAEFDAHVEKQHQASAALVGRNWKLLNDLAQRPAAGAGGVSGDELAAAVRQAREQGASQERHRCEARLATVGQEHKAALANATARQFRALTAHAKTAREREEALEGLVTEAVTKAASETRVVVARELDEFRARYLREAAARRALYNRLVEIEGNIRVFCRVRPIMPFELAHGGEEARDVTKQAKGTLDPPTPSPLPTIANLTFYYPSCRSLLRSSWWRTRAGRRTSTPSTPCLERRASSELCLATPSLHSSPRCSTASTSASSRTARLAAASISI